jgi:hypothetical protein
MISSLIQSFPPAQRFCNAKDFKRLPLAAVGGGRSGLVGQDVLDLLHDLGSDLGKQLHGLAVVLNLGNLGGTEDDSADVGVHHAPIKNVSICMRKSESNACSINVPGKRKLCDGATELLSDLGKTPDLLDLGLALFGLKSLDRALEEALVGGETAVLGNTVVVLASEETRGERRPDSGTVLVLVVERSVLDLEALTVEGVVLGLLGDGSNEVVPDVC